MMRRATSAAKAPLVWRAREGLEGLAAAPVGGGGAWPDNEPTRRAKLAARTACGRAAAHGAVRPSRAHQAAGPDGAQKTSGATRNTGDGPPPTAQPGPVGHTKGPGPRLASQRGPTVPGIPVAPLIDARIQPECPASRVARWTPPRPASWAAWVRHEKPSARYTASGCADRDGSRECDATATDRS